MPTDGDSPAYTDPVDAGIAIGATFSEPIQQDSVTMTCAMETLPDALTTASGDIPGEVNYDSNTNISFIPSVPLKAARRYTVSISGAKDVAGNEMSGTYSFSFELKTPERVRWYRVKEGDTLQSVADRPDTYDDESKWETIVRVNQNLEDYMFSRDLKPGQRLLIK
jgi:nucleoid-associated protein YgaU